MAKKILLSTLLFVLVFSAMFTGVVVTSEPVEARAADYCDAWWDWLGECGIWAGTDTGRTGHCIRTFATSGC